MSMKAQLSLADVDAIKAVLLRQLPNVKSSHRVEAMARGLGYGSNAALRAELSRGRQERIIDDRAFVNYLEEHGFIDTQHDTLSEAVIHCEFTAERAAIKAVMAKTATLTNFGFGVFDGHKKASEQRAAEMLQGREDMLTSHAVAEFVRACQFLAPLSKRTTVNTRVSSYGLKHQAEHFHRERGVEDAYISNGMFIAAAIHLGFKLKENGPNAYLNIATGRTALSSGGSSKSAKFIGGKIRTQAWRNMMIAAINAGVALGLFGLESDDNRWPGFNREPTCEGRQPYVYRFVFAGMPAIASVHDAGYGELAIHVAVNPTEQAEEHIKVGNAGLYAGDAFASGWLERRKGAWLQTSARPASAFRREILPMIAAASAEPTGYKDHGQFML